MDPRRVTADMLIQSPRAVLAIAMVMDLVVYDDGEPMLAIGPHENRAALEARVSVLEAKLAKTYEALVIYGDHSPDCPGVRDGKLCDCGYGEALDVELAGKGDDDG